MGIINSIVIVVGREAVTFKTDGVVYRRKLIDCSKVTIYPITYYNLLCAFDYERETKNNDNKHWYSYINIMWIRYLFNDSSINIKNKVNCT